MRRRSPLLRLVTGLSLALLVTAAGGLWLLRFDRVVVAPGRLAGESIAVNSPAAGRVIAVLVAAGDTVEAGQLLLRLDASKDEAEAARLQLRIEHSAERARVLREEFERQSGVLYPYELEQAAREVERARLEAAQAEIESRAIGELGRQGLAGQLKVEAAEMTARLAEMALEEARQAVPLLEERQRSRSARMLNEIDSLEGEIAEERGRRGEALRRLELSKVLAGAPGIALGDDLSELVGRYASEGEELLRLAVAPANRFEGTLTDIGRAPVRPGLPAKIRLDGYPWLIHGTLAGSVTRVAERRGADDGFLVTLEIDGTEPPGALYEGMRGEARIVAEESVTLGRLLLERVTGSESP